MPQKQPTKKQHYVPITYLKGFSPDDNLIYQYNLKLKKAISNPVDIESVCRDIYLYEFRDNEDNIINLNFIEDILCGYEGKFAEYKRKLISKVSHKENFNTCSFLSKDEKDFWRVYTALHIMRNPATIQVVQNIFREEYPEALSENEAKNIALSYCLPFLNNIENKENNVLILFLYVLLRHIISVGITDSDSIFTSDHAIYGFRNSAKQNLLEFETLWFPVTSNCTLIFSNPKNVDSSMRNRLIPLGDEEVRYLNKGIAYIASEMVFSKHPFSDEDVKLIEKARNERALDEQRKKMFSNTQTTR